ncbi:MAG: choice-of-anchor J domain-containing protein, partial [Bacteroidales bacterium]|nr:choice-of-anchor J domain-containing protein [Bacteroidales bacterium]
MKRKFIFLVMLFALLGGVNLNVLNAQNVIEIGEGSATTNGYIPLNTYYYTSISQQIYLSDQINSAGSITEISFKRYSGTNKARDMEVYMVETTKTQFDGTSDWITMTEADRVFNGTLPYNGTANGWFSIKLDIPFDYTGEKNLVVCVNIKNTYTYDNTNYFYTFDTDNSMALYLAHDGTTANPSNMTSSGKLLNKLNQIRFTIEASVEPSVPTNLVATTQDYESIALTWETAENAKSYNIYQNGEKIDNVTGTSYVATGLNELTEYSFTITSVNGSKESAHSNTATAKTTETPTPDTPTNLIATFVSYNEINLKWDAVENAKSYNIYFGETLFGNSSTTEAYCSNLDANTAYKFTVTAVIGSKESGHSNEVNATSVSADAQEIALGEVRMGDYLTEKTQVSKSFNVTKAFTSITSILPDDDFFTVSYDSSVNPIIVNVSYDKTANKTGEQTANIIIKSSDFEDVVVTVSATAYTPSEGDVKELAKQITLNGSYTDNVTGMYDDYILPGETNDGNNGDAVYSFTLTEDALITANVEGTNGLAAIYKAEELANNVPSSNNNYEGKVMEVAPTAPTSFFYDFEDGSLEDFNLVEYDGNNDYWQATTSSDDRKCIVSYSYRFQMGGNISTADNYIYTKNKYAITANSKLLFDTKILSTQWPDQVMVKVSTNGEEFILIETIDPMSENWVSKTINLGDKFVEKGLEYGEYHIALHHKNNYQERIYIDNLQLTDGSSKSRSVEPQINAVHYEAGEYYLVAAAEEGNFTLNISTATLPAPEATVYTAPENGAIEQNNPKLSWTFGEYTDKYQVLLGTTNPPTDVVVDWTSELATSFQTELSNNTVYYWQVNVQNAIGTTTAGEVYSFITPLNQATELAVTDAELYPGETTTLTWTAAEDALSYNVYLNDTVKLNETAIEETSFELTNLPHNVNPGNAITVTAVHTLGESAHSEAIYVKMAGEFNLVVNVKDAEGNAIENAAVAFITKSNYDAYYDEYYQLVPAIETLYTDAEGKVTQTLAMPCVYGSPNWTYSYLEIVISKEYATSQSFGITSYTEGLSAGQDFVKDITLEYVAPQNVKTDKYYYVEGEDMVLTWNEVEGAVGYNVYKVGYSYEIYDYVYTLVNEEAITDTTFTVENLKYDLESLYVTYAVTADYGFGESAKNAKVYPGVTGEGQIAGNVTDGTNPIKGATVTIVGYDGFDRPQTYTFVTNEDGEFTGDMLIGSYYTATVSHYDYNEKVIENVAIEYQTELPLDIVLEAKQKADFDVTAVESGDYVNVTWGAAEGATSYNVYRRDSEGNVQRIYSDVTSLTATDYYWSTLEAGTYEYGVNAMTVQEGLNITEDFEDGIPSTWAVYNLRNNPTSGFNWTTKDNHNGIQSYEGTYAAYAKSSTYGTEGLDHFYLVTDLIDLTTVNNPQLSFAYYTPGYYGGNTYCNTLKVKILTESDGQTSATDQTNHIWSNNKTHTDSWQVATVDLTAYIGQKVYVAFENYPYYGYCSSIDYIKITSQGNSSESKVNWSNEVVREAYATFNNAAGDNNWSNEANWSTGAVPQAGENVMISTNANLDTIANVANMKIAGSATLTLNDGAELTVTGTITQVYDSYTYTTGKLVINDGAQIFQSNESVYATFNMNMVNPSEWGVSEDGWQFIASPFNSSSITNFTGLSWAPKSYDLYKFEGAEEGAEWNNHKDGNFEDAFVNGRGYLASYETLTTATLSGYLYNKDNFDFTEVTYTEGGNFANFHLLGNPFSFNMDWSNITVENVYEAFATVDPSTGGYVNSIKSGVTTIPVGDGFFVEAIGENPSISYNAGSKSRGEKVEYINVVASGKQGSNNVIIKLSGKEEKGFSK